MKANILISKLIILKVKVLIKIEVNNCNKTMDLKK